MAAKSRGLKNIYRAGAQKQLKKDFKKSCGKKKGEYVYGILQRGSKSDASVTERVIS